MSDEIPVHTYPTTQRHPKLYAKITSLKNDIDVLVYDQQINKDVYKYLFQTRKDNELSNK